MSALPTLYQRLKKRLHSLDTRIPPPVIFLITAGIMFALADKLSVNSVSLVVASVIAGLAFTFALLGVLAFHQHQTTIHPQHPENTHTLVTTGVYSLTRNPMYLSMFLILVSWGILLETAITLLLPFVYASYIQHFQIYPEERVLAEKFGDTYTTYRQTVARWLWLI